MSANEIPKAIDRLLVIQNAYSESQNALNVAVALVNRKTDVRVLDIQPPLSEFWHSIMNDVEGQSIERRIRTLRESVSNADFKCNSVTCEGHRGCAMTEVLRQVAEFGHQLVIKESQQHLTDYLFGGLDFRLVRDCPSPLMLLHPSAKSIPQRILVSINAEFDPNGYQLNRELLDYATFLAETFHAQLGVVSALPANRQAFTHAPDIEFLDRAQQKENRHHREYRAKLVQLIRDSSKSIHPEHVFARSGRSSDVVLSVIDYYNPDLLVIGGTAHQGPLIENSVARALRKIGCSILTIKPQGFHHPFVSDTVNTRLKTPTAPACGNAEFLF